MIFPCFKCLTECYWRLSAESERTFFPLRKNLLKPWRCFSGVEIEDEGDNDFIDLRFWRFELQGELEIELTSVSDGLKGMLYALCLLVASMASIALWFNSWKPRMLGALKTLGILSKRSSFSWCLLVLVRSEGEECNAFNCLPRRNIDSWHSASFSAAAAISLSWKMSELQDVSDATVNSMNVGKMLLFCLFTFCIVIGTIPTQVARGFMMSKTETRKRVYTRLKE